jgi:phage baseplate assembly protein V
MRSAKLLDMSEDLARRLANLIRFGTVDSVTIAPPRVRVKVGGLLTTPRPWVSLGSGKGLRRWSPPSPGEQVVYFSPNGDLSAGIAVCGIPSNLLPPPDGATADNFIFLFGDGAVLLYDIATHVLRGTLPEGGRVEVTAPGGFLFKGDSRFEGNMKVTGDTDVDGASHTAGKITSDVDVVAGSISLVNHKTKGVTRGSALSDGPQ